MSRGFLRDLEDLRRWLTNTWFRQDEQSPYHLALRSLILQLWPDPQKNSSDSGTYTFLNVPALCFRSLGGTSDSILPINCAWIFLYAAFYLLDKVEDQETEHVLFSRFGEGPLTNLTTGLVLQAGGMLSFTAQASPEIDRIRAIQTEFYRLAVDVCAGQHLDLTLEEPNLEQAWAIATAKSGTFFSLGCRMGAQWSGAMPEQVDAFGEYGRHLGTLVQIANDYKGLFPDKNGKSDIILGKYSLPIAYSSQVLPDQEKKALLALLSANDTDLPAKNRALQMVIQSGALLYLYLEAEKQKSLAASALEPLSLAPEVKEILLSLPEKIAGGLSQNGN